MIEFDADAGVAYVQLKEGKIVRTEEIAPEVFADFNKKGEILGIEFVNPQLKEIGYHYRRKSGGGCRGSGINNRLK